MRRAILSALLAAAFALPVSAHHVDVAVSDSDYDAKVSFIAEYAAQRTAIVEAAQLYFAVKAASEKADALLLVENSIEASIAHMRSLDVRECFTLIAQVAVDEFEDAAAYFAAIRANDEAAEAAAGTRANESGSLMSNPRFVALFDCGDSDEHLA